MQIIKYDHVKEKIIEIRAQKIIIDRLCCVMHNHLQNVILLYRFNSSKI